MIDIEPFKFYSPERKLIAAIIIQAINDAFGSKKCHKAKKFISPDNTQFCLYCWSLDIDPEYLCEKITKLKKSSLIFTMIRTRKRSSSKQVFSSQRVRSHAKQMRQSHEKRRKNVAAGCI